jgi:hypothetical protein
LAGFHRKSRICKTKLATGCPCDSKHHEGSWQERVEHNLVLFIPLALRFEWTRSRKLAETSCIAMIKLYREALWGWNFTRGKAVAKWRAESLAFQTVPSETSDCFPRGTGALRRPSKLVLESREKGAANKRSESRKNEQKKKRKVFGMVVVVRLDDRYLATKSTRGIYPLSPAQTQPITAQIPT